MAARRLAAAGYRTIIVDKRKVVGEPVQCAEGVSAFGLASNGLKPEAEWAAHKVFGAKCIVPDGHWFYITRLPGFAIDRPSFDRWILQGALDDGAVLRMSTRVTSVSSRPEGWRLHADGDPIDARAVVAADGPASLIARCVGLARDLERIPAYEYRFRRSDVPDLDSDYFRLYAGKAYQGGYAWIFPKGDTVNVGAGGHIDAHAAAIRFCQRHGIDVNRRLQIIAGSIPYRFDLSTRAVPGLAVAGDAAGVTNPINGAGIHPAIFSGRLAGEFAVLALSSGDPRAILGYDEAIRESPFLNPLLWWMIERIRTWTDRLMNALGQELHGREWRAAGFRKAFSTLRRRPWFLLRAREFYRMMRALELCERYGW